jgi:spoIIIJ-associated protein
MSAPVEVEATGETVGEAKWSALRELERLHPGIDKSAVSFEVLFEGERGLLGVGYAPARVIASVPSSAVVSEGAGDLSELGAGAREIVERVAAALGVTCRIDVVETDDTVTVSCSGPELGVLIGRRGQTIDALQYLANAIVARGYGEERKHVVVDAAGYRSRRQATLEALALRTADRVRQSGETVALEPMTAIERKIVHTRLVELNGVETWSEGDEPNRHVVVGPA